MCICMCVIAVLTLYCACVSKLRHSVRERWCSRHVRTTKEEDGRICTSSLGGMMQERILVLVAMATGCWESHPLTHTHTQTHTLTLMYKHTHKSIKSNTTPILDFTAEVEEAAATWLEDTEEMKSVTKQSKEEKNHNYFIIRCCFLLLQKCYLLICNLPETLTFS